MEFWGTVEALYPSCRSIASAAFRLATFLLGPVPVATSLFTLTYKYTHTDTKQTKTQKSSWITSLSGSKPNILAVQKHGVMVNELLKTNLNALL